MLGLFGQIITVGAHAVGLGTHVSPAVQNRSLTEFYVTQPAISAHGRLGAFSFMSMVNFEGLTLNRGELNHGVWGEGYVDRRHPHTFLHEAVLTFERELLQTRVSITAGRGFAPFGTDDPMVRPFVKYPSNHHISQILERHVAIAALRRGSVILEGGLFGGQEPVGPRDMGDFETFGDSWSARVTYLPTRWLETQVSYASVNSPENEFGVGLDHQQWSASARVEKSLGATDVYALVEGGELSEADEESTLFFFHTLLAEVGVQQNGWQIGARLERSERPEEERELTIFRSVRPAAHYSILGITRWTTASALVSRSLRITDRLGMRPFIEISHQSATPLEEPAILDPDNLYGQSKLWSFSFGIRSTIGSWHSRMGRYGAALAATSPAHNHH